MHPIWNSVVVPGVPLVEKVLRTVVVYVFLLVGLRLAGKREVGQLNPFDLVVLLLLSNTVQNAIIGKDDSLLGGLFGASLLLTLNYAVVRFLFLHPRLDRLAEGSSAVLIRDGEVLQRNLQRELITRTELRSAARRQGIDHLSDIACARIEVGGALSFVTKHPSADEQQRSELVERLGRLEHKLDLLLAGDARNSGGQ